MLPFRAASASGTWERCKTLVSPVFRALTLLIWLSPAQRPCAAASSCGCPGRPHPPPLQAAPWRPHCVPACPNAHLRHLSGTHVSTTAGCDCLSASLHQWCAKQHQCSSPSSPKRAAPAPPSHPSASSGLKGRGVSQPVLILTDASCALTFQPAYLKHTRLKSGKVQGSAAACVARADGSALPQQLPRHVQAASTQTSTQV